MKYSPITVSAIVPFFNEEKQVTKVIRQLLKSSLIDEVICINDGSTDKSLDEVHKFNGSVTVISLKKNHGKGYALSQGVKKAKGKIVVFFDSDLTNLTLKHIETLINPILENKARAVLGYPTGGYFSPLFKDVTGERAYYRRDIVPHLNVIAKTNRFSTEYYLNEIFSASDIKRVPLQRLMHLYKHEKYPMRQAVKEIIRDILAITLQLSKTGILKSKDIKLITTNISNMTSITTLKELKDKINQIKNQKVKKYLKKTLLYFYRLH